ncbi:uncharacterized protein BX664DRAFT_320215 [Halteromyces radiatus]|uniref:uncharacterized protein n=1 Tax=Halteromyces radiatus TaxID=101107 RepID=UPI0022204562|nr:uncharacterized protein BX664DRAFT_320215 [Halteromyces radiatus]KAI8099031.1 hypothetical protein BX664DRAFT_320215 [Halteromyces radiatus]
MKVVSIVSSLVLLGLAQTISALPIFEIPNDFDRYGKQCPLKPMNNVACPTLCVTDHSLCPSALAPTCPTGQQFCGDGTCQSTCKGIDNMCSCGDTTLPTNYVPCAAGQQVNITHFDPRNAETQTQQVCAASVNVTQASIYPVYNQSSVWVTCPAVVPYFTWREPMWIAIWTYVALQAFILITWHLYKTTREYPFHREFAAATAAATATTTTTSALASSASLPFSGNKNNVVNEKAVINGAIVDEKKNKMVSDTSSEASSLRDSERLRFRGFKNDYFGWFALGSVVITTLLFIVFLACIVSDNYGNLAGGVELYVFLTGDLSSQIYCVVWHVSGAWFAVLLMTQQRLRNYFRIESYAHTCPYIQVERKQDPLIFLDDGSKWLAKFREIEAKFVQRFGWDISIITAPVRKTTNNVRYFEYQCMRYVYNAQKTRFEPYEFDLGTTHRQLQGWADGVSSEEAFQRLELLGPNLIRVQVPSIPRAVIQEFASLLYLYQMMCMWVWYYFKYYQMGLVQTCIILLSAFIRVFLRLRGEYHIRDMAEQKTVVRVYRDGEWLENISSSDIIPGDIFEVEEMAQVPCDAVILSGDVVVNESSLTGEAMPIRKFAIPHDDNIYEMMGSGKINTLFAGTTVAQVNLVDNGIDKKKPTRVYALALRTGITTEKGSLIHKILFPSPVSFIFNEHIKVAIGVLLIWGLIAFALSIYLMGRGNITSWYYGIFVMSQIFSPLLPAAFTINQSVCAARLRGKKILCIDLPRINLSGKVRIFCFDKTGTLTREGLEFFGAVSKSTTDGENERVGDPTLMQPTFAMGIATCHAVTKMKDQYIGNPVDIESFNAMKWELLPTSDPMHLDTLRAPSTDPNHINEPVHVIRRFEFVHARASQSVAVHDPRTNHVHVFLKGSFERIKTLSTKQSIPDDYDQTAARYAKEGCYVLAMSHRDLGVLDVDVTMEDIKRMSRDDLEKDCSFIGFVLFRNMLKHDTTDAIAELKGGDTRVVMITGDTALTGIFIARQCGMIVSHHRVILGDLVAGNMVWHDVDSGEYVDVDDALASDPREDHEKQVELALTGRAFEWLCAQRTMRRYLLHTRVFARMTPGDKVQCVQLHMEKGVTAMCGDGGNDCGALRAAHVGLALSEAEASIVSPFSTNNRSVMQCVELLRQGRSALATSFANYKFLIFYGECMAFWELLMFYFTVIGPQPIWISIDGFTTTTMTFAITQALPAARLGRSRPTAKPLGIETLASCLGIVFINFWFIVSSVIWLFQQDWFICNEFDSSSIDASRWWLLGDNYESEIIALVVMAQFFHNGALVNFGSVFRRSWWRNYTLVFIWCCFFVHISYLVLADPNPYSCIFRINCGTASVLEELGYPKPWWSIDPYNAPLGHNVLPTYFRWQLWGFILANMVATVIWERLIVLGLARNWAIKRAQAHPNKKRILFKL